MNAKEIQKKYRRFKRLEAISDRAMKAWEADINNATLEAKYDASYREYFGARESLVKALMRLTKQNRQVVNAMIASDKFRQLMGLTIV